ncbi:hypothetical protein V9L20_11370 [Variovorax sp. CCNWLW225]|jgi:hypothetical protein|uniref:hypothetical protein n=1 Tax=Variovorax sp. CCNWLW225 TaxID=3127462 RepID=UPI00307810ED
MNAVLRFLSSAGAAAAILLLPGLAAAAYPCNGSPGERRVGMAGGSHGVGPFPLCVAGPAPAPSAPRDAYAASVDTTSFYDAEMERMVRSIKAQHNAVVTEKARMAAIEEKMARDPAFKRMYLGGWEVFRVDPKARPGKTCTAAWKKQGQLVSISGPGPQHDGGMLTFWGADIPQPADIQTITVTMKQSRYPAQTVKAVNYSMPGLRFGAIALTVPDIDKAIDTMLDVEHFELLIDGRTVSNIGWNGGHDAREKLRQCVRAG